MKERLTDVEIQLMHHENSIQELNETVTRQQLVIEKLLTDFRQMLQHLQIISPSPVGDLLDEEPPPHY
ncbi:MAG: SlyX family protein [Deltaproteobacteria bacterium]|jgi:SlyX protein